MTDLEKQEPLYVSIVFLEDNEMSIKDMVAAAVHSALRVESETYFFVDMSNQYRKAQKTLLPKCLVKTIQDAEDFDYLIEKCKIENIPVGVERKYKKKNNGAVTCLTIGPDIKSKIVGITRKLKNYKE